ncbi:hypothetical protein NIES970_18360 [[Synechococcus] sp. NIES-970]|nr:hypothetical protein NIES970_18360 [[Synechococcus] sp. NIES-970]
MLIIGATMIYRSQDDQTTAIAQRETSSGLAAAETGINRVYNFLTANRVFSQYPSSDGLQSYSWQNDQTWETLVANADTNPIIVDQCFTETAINEAVDELELYVGGVWVPIDENRPEEGQFQVISYEYIGADKDDEKNIDAGVLIGRGILQVKGRVNTDSEDDTGDSDLGTAISSLQVEIPILKNQPAVRSVPGLWSLSPYLQGNQKVEGDIMVSGITGSGCDIFADGVLDALQESIVGPGQVIPAPGVSQPDLPPLPALENRNEIAAITGNATFPRAGDKFVTRTIDGVTTEVYHYNIGTVPNGSKSPLSIDLGGSRTVTVRTGTKTVAGETRQQMVIFHANGSVSVGGSASIRHLEMDTVNAANNKAFFQLYGRGSTGTPAGSFATPDFFLCMNGTPESSYFVLGPDYTYGVNGGGGAAATIYGTVWVKQVSNSNITLLSGATLPCGSSSNQIIVKQELTMDDLTAVEDILGQTGVLDGDTPTPPVLRPFINWRRLSND